jgi:hypothetical protein
MKSVPPMSDLFKMTGMELPSFLGKDIPKEVKVEVEEKVVKEKPVKEEVAKETKKK